MKEFVLEWIKHFYYRKLSSGMMYFDQAKLQEHAPLWSIGLLIAILFVCYIVWFVSRFILIRVTYMFFDRTKTKWDDYLIQNRFFKGVAILIPLMFLENLLSIAFFQYPSLTAIFSKIIEVSIIFVVIVVINRFLSTARDILNDNEKYRDKPIQSYIQVGKMSISIILGIIIISRLTGISPSTFFGTIGAASAIVLLIFKDTILGFVGSLQLGANDMVRIGDWVTMDKYGADGSVEEISLATVKVRNFDRTITTIPTYAMVSDSFKNWRGMVESDGRRIKRSIRIHIDTIKFADEELINRLKNIAVLKDFITRRQQEIDDYNIRNGFVGENSINGRRQTNLGIFRKYVEHYLLHKVEINKDMALIVRQLEPSDTGIPIEIYCFTKTKVWYEYEAVQSDIFDHVLSMVPLFDLKIFEQPTGNDFRRLVSGRS